MDENDDSEKYINENAQSRNYIDENIDSIGINYCSENDTEFKLPHRFAARLLKKTITKSNSEKILQNLKNIPLPQPKTIVVRSKKSKTQQCQNGQANNKKLNANKQSAFVKETEDCRYVSWINSVIATGFKIENLNVDMTRIINDCMISEQSTSTKNRIVTNASVRASQIPLKDGISSIAYKEIKMMDKLRVKAVNLYQSDQLKFVKQLLMENLKIGRFYIREDKSIHADVGVKKHILEIFSNYNPLWLKIAIETVFGIKIEKSTKKEVHTLVQSLNHNLLSFKEKLLKKNCKSLTTYFMNENNVNRAKLHILYHFLILVHFLDVAKRNRLIDHDPCLFRTDAACKTSRDIIISFSRVYITGVGDIIKSLRNVGIHLEHKQNSIEEFNFTVTNLDVDLRCGVRLARMAEILLPRNDILPILYYPPNLITKKMHNMDLVFSVLKPALIELPTTIVPKDICNGYRQKTLIFLDKLIGFSKIRIREAELLQSIDSIIKIQQTFRRYLQCKQNRQNFLQLKSSALFIQRRFRANQLMKKERQNYLKIRFSVIIIQKAYRSHKLFQNDKENYQNLRKAAIFVQRQFRANLEMRKCRTRYLKMNQIVSVIQQRYRAKVVGRKQRQEYLQLRQVIFVQRLYRANKRGNHFKSVVIQYWQLNNLAATVIQRLWRGYSVRKQLHREMPKLAEINQNLKIIAKDITEDKILFNIINKILERFSRIQSINHLHHDVEKLKFGTTNSIEVCQTITKNDWILTTLIYSFNSFNRSEPHKKIIQNILAIFMNILCKTNCQVLYCNAKLFKVLLKIVRNFPKTDLLLCQTCQILVHLFNHSETLKLFKKDLHLIQALQSFINKKKFPLRNPINRSVYSLSVVNHRSTAFFIKNINSLSCLASKLSTLINN